MRWFAKFCSQQLADLTDEVASLRNQLHALRAARDEWRRSCQRAQARHSLAERSIRDSADQLAGLQKGLAAARLAEADASDRNRVLEARMAKLAGELDGLGAELRRSEHELELSNKQLELACKENELLAKIHQGDLARRERELALEKRAKADAELFGERLSAEA